ncbi:hypothetical protein HX780_06650 [Pseudomonas tolaasii]|nr:hypothetical protein [Pseudomonas tolaasii]
MRWTWSYLKTTWSFLRKIPGRLIELLLVATGLPWLSEKSSKWLARKGQFLFAAIGANLLSVALIGLPVWGLAAHWNEWGAIQRVSACLSIVYLALRSSESVYKSYKEFKHPEEVGDIPEKDCAAG